MTEVFHVFPAAGTGAGMRKPPAAGDIASYYGKLTGFSDFCRRKLLFTTGKNLIFRIFAVEKSHSLRVKPRFSRFLPYSLRSKPRFSRFLPQKRFLFAGKPANRNPACHSRSSAAMDGPVSGRNDFPACRSASSRPWPEPENSCLAPGRIFRRV